MLNRKVKRYLEEFGLGIAFFLLIWLMPLLFIFFYHAHPNLVMNVALILFVLSLVPTRFKGGAPFSAGLSISMIFSFVLGLHCYYGSVAQLRQITEGREYRGVYAGQEALPFRDASLLHFAPGSVPDGSRAVGLRDTEKEVHTYCVAPILRMDLSETELLHRVNYWSVGIDCCSANGDFQCDDSGAALSGLPNSNQGFTLFELPEDRLLWLARAFVPPIERRDLFLKAIRKAEAVHGMASSENPVFVRWIKKDRAAVIAEKSSAILVTVLLASIFALVAAGILAYQAMGLFDIAMMIAEVDAHVSAAKNLPTNVAPGIADFVDKTEEDMHRGHKAKTAGAHFLTTCLLPFLIVMTFTMVWSWLPNFAFGWLIMSVLIVFTTVTVSALLCTSHSWVHGLALLAMVLMGTHVGRLNYYKNTFHYFDIQDRRAYSNVDPGIESFQYLDAGRIAFDATAQVRTMYSSGYQEMSTNFCVAPIMNPGADGANVHFWAVGQDCCDPHGKFWCDDANDKQAHGGVVINRVEQTEEVVDDLVARYRKAVRSAVARYNIKEPERTTFVRWVKDPQATHAEYLSSSFGVILLLGSVFMLFLSCTSIGGFLMMKRQRKQAQRASQPGV
jgi:hypothetical protein